MKNIILYHNHKSITGSLLDSFEYYIETLTHTKNIFLYFLKSYNNSIGLKLKDLFSLVNERYILDDLNWQDNIKIVSRSEIIRNKFNNVLMVDYQTPKFIRGLLKANKIILLSELDKKDSKLNYKLYDNIIKFGEMPFCNFDKKYTGKFLFNRYKDITKSKTQIFINAPKHESLADKSFLNNILDSFNKAYFLKGKTHKTNLFSEFDEYAYIHCGTWYDPRPRLFHECYYYGKKLNFINPNEYVDGALYRWTDLQTNGLKNRFLDENDEIVQELLT